MKPLMGAILFPQKDGKSTQEKPFIVLSTRQEVNSELARSLRLAGFTQVEMLSQTLASVVPLQISADAHGVIIDIGPLSCSESVVTTLLAIIPRNVWCCVVGDSDSITLAQSFANYGIHYFNLSAQREMVIQAAISGATLAVRRWALSISVLGCKGGVGNSWIAWQLATRILQLRPAPTLYIQGSAASQDLDLLAGKKLQQDVTQVSKNLDALRSGEAYLPDLSQESFLSYNFVLFDQAIHTADKETLRQIAGQSSCLVLVMDRSMTSIRLARRMIDTVEAINRAGLMSRRLLLCLNDTRPPAPEMLTQEDMESLLGKELHFVIPWHGQSRSLFRRRSTRTPLESLTLQILGEPAKTLSASRWAVKNKDR